MDYPTPDSSTFQPTNKQKRSHAESETAEEAPRKRQKWVFKPLVYDGPDDPESDLCQRCQTIDFEAISQLQINQDGIPVFDFKRHPVSAESSCSMCAYLQSESSKKQNPYTRAREEGWHLRAHRSWDLFTKRISRRDKERHGVVLKLHPGRPRKTTFNQGRRCSLLIPTLKGNEANSSRTAWMGGQALSRMNFDLAPLLAPLQCCIDTHQCTPAPAPALPDSTTFIDCRTRKLVLLPHGAQYITLSYVWGKRKHSEEEAREESDFIRDMRRLPVKIPQTIEDAVRVVLLSQQRYLWVDRYCIDQYHSAQKQIQISAMADIYEGALFTIIALGDDADYGLHGISRPFNAQLLFKIRGREYLSTGRCLQDHLEESTWAQRAWVYQEAVLSRRCLIFTPEQAFLTCLQSTASQVLPTLIPRNASHQLFQDQEYFSPRMIRPLQHTGQKDKGYAWLQSHLDQYNRRTMSRSTDALNAFRGILSRSGLVSWWGIPIHQEHFRHTLSAEEESTGRFVCGLLWRIINPQAAGMEDHSNRYSQFPSWTWAPFRTSTIEFPALIGVFAPTTIFCPELLVAGDSGAEAVSFHSFAEGQLRSSLPESVRIILLTTFSMKMEVLRSGRLVEVDTPRALIEPSPVAGIDSSLSWVASWDHYPTKGSLKEKTSKQVTALLMRVKAGSQSFGGDCFVAESYYDLSCNWLIVEEFEGKPARRMGVLYTYSRKLDKSRLAWRSIELG